MKLGLYLGIVALLSAGTVAQDYSSSKKGKPQAANQAMPTGATEEGTKGDNSTPSKQPAMPSVSSPNDYVIGEQDVLNITVWKEPELSGAVVVRPDGKITVPLVNEVHVIGLTPTALQDLLTEKLKPFVTVPQVTVSVREINSRKVYLIGNAAREGPFRINSSMTVLQLIAEAGGLRDFAKRSKIYIMRNEDNQQKRFQFNYDEVIRGKNMGQDIVLRPGDTVVVP